MITVLSLSRNSLRISVEAAFNLKLCDDVDGIAEVLSGKSADIKFIVFWNIYTNVIMKRA